MLPLKAEQECIAAEQAEAQRQWLYKGTTTYCSRLAEAQRQLLW